jgi:hypothetical protein
MYYELVTADIILADISILNPNVFYELGVRHGAVERVVINTARVEANDSEHLYAVLLWDENDRRWAERDVRLRGPNKRTGWSFGNHQSNKAPNTRAIEKRD